MKYFFLISMMVLTACEGGVRESLGINRNAPDEFVVVSRPPLSVPPEFDLVPPTPGAISPQESARGRAQSALLGGSETAVESVSAAGTASSAEASFLSKLKVDEADPNIRQVLGKDLTTKPPTKDAKSLLEKLNITPTQQPVVDAKKETERLRANKKSGKPVTEGETPTVDSSKKKSVLDVLF